MSKINENEATYLIALNAWEEAPLNELKWEIEEWDSETIDTLAILVNWIERDLILVSQRTADKANPTGSSLSSKTESIRIATSHEQSTSHSFFIHLTESGKRLWEEYDWSISKERAEELAFPESRRVSCVR